MSNANVGAVYEHIIDEVINTVRVDFEEGGVGEDILEELKKVSALSHFPVIITSLLRQPGWRSASTPIRFPLSFSSCFSFSSKWDEHGFFITDASFLQRRSASAGALVRIVGDASAALAGSLDGGGVESSSFWGDGRASRYLGLFLSSRRVCRRAPSSPSPPSDWRTHPSRHVGPFW